MKLVKIFVASSNELADDRIHLGDCVRRVNDVYELQEVRVKLYKWEDFSPFYTGKRSQDEYNNYLTQCDGVIALFDTKVGEYTSEEIKVALDKLGRDSLSCYAKVTDERPYIHNDVATFFSRQGFDSKIYSNPAQLFNIVIELVERLLHKGVNDKMYPQTSLVTYFYATIPDDNAEKRHLLGDVIRELDDKREYLHNERCKLFPYREPDKISKSNIYMALMKDVGAKVDEDEIRRAKIERDKNTLGGLVIYYENGGAFKYSGLWNEINNWGYFMPEYKTMSDVRWHLNEYMDRRIVKCSDDYVVEKGRLYTKGIQVGEVGDISFLAEYEPATVKIADVKELEHRLEERMSVLGARVYDKSDDEIVDLSYEMDTFDKEIQKSILISVLEQSMRITILKPITTITREYVSKCNGLLKDIVAKLLKGGLSEGEIQADVKMHWQMVSVLFNKGVISTDKCFAILSAWLMLLEKIYDIYSVQLYNELLAFADKYDIVNRRSEELREKLSSFYNKHGNVLLSIKLHRKALNNYCKIDDSSVSFRKRLSQSYLDYCSIFLNNELRDITLLRQAMDNWCDMVRQWCNEDDAFLPEFGDYMSVVLRAQNMWNVFVNEHFKQNLSVMHEAYIVLRSRFESLPNRAKENLLYMGNMLATLYLDHPGKYASMRESYSRCREYLHLTIEKALQYYTINPQGALFWVSMSYHNYAFLQRKAGALEEAVIYYKKALDFRRQILRKQSDPTSHELVGETLVNYGDVLRQLKDYEIAISIAKEAIEMYKYSKENSSFFLTRLK